MVHLENGTMVPECGQRGFNAMPAAPKPTFWNLDFKSLLPVVLFLIAQMIMGATWITRIDSRLTMREAMVEPTLKRIERLELDRDAIIRVQEQLKSMAFAIDKIDVKLDRAQQQR